MDDVVGLVRRSLTAATSDTFDRRVDEQAADLSARIRNGSLDNADLALGLELECYLVDGQGRVAPLPEGQFANVPVSRELGLHNLEINTPAAVFDGNGIEAQAEAIRERLDAARRVASGAGLTPVLDGMWTIPPAEGTASYLSSTREVDGVVIAENMSESPRYYALDNSILRHAGGEIELDLPGARFTVPTILVESLTSSIQPHLQIPEARTLPVYYNTAIRTLGPVLALATNSPFLPLDLYGDADPETVLDGTYHELRVPVFEQSINAGLDLEKVCFPTDIDEPEDVIRNLVEDQTVAPFLREWVDEEEEETFTDTFWELDHKHGTYWRWLRPEVGGDPIDDDNTERSLRIEYRPIPTQPSVRDIVGLQCLVAGLIHGLVVADHPLRRLDWNDARQSFYGAVEEGLEADLRWMTVRGDETSNRERIFEEVFEFARRGLRDRGIADDRIEHYLVPIERRWQARTAPSDWKREQVAARLADGADLDEAIREMQSEYVDRTGTPFAEWL